MKRFFFLSFFVKIICFPSTKSNQIFIYFLLFKSLHNSNKCKKSSNKIIRFIDFWYQEEKANSKALGFKRKKEREKKKQFEFVLVKITKSRRQIYKNCARDAKNSLVCSDLFLLPLATNWFLICSNNFCILFKKKQ